MSEPNMFDQVAQAMADMQADHDRVMAEVVAERGRLRAAVDAALALHATHACGKGCANDGKRCQACWEEAPCATVRALAPVADPDPHTTSEKEQ
jgi:hypothetical protein